MGYFSDKFNHHNDDMQAHFKDLFHCNINDAVCVEDFFKIKIDRQKKLWKTEYTCLLYTSDAADE